MLIAFGLIFAIILIKYKPMYKVSVSGVELGYLDIRETLEENIKDKMMESENINIDSIELNKNPEYEFKLISRNTDKNQQEINTDIEDDITVTYKYYEIAIGEGVIQKVNSLEDAEELINIIKSENDTADLTIDEKYTQIKV